MTKKDFIALARYLTDESLADWCMKDGNVDAVKLREHLANFCHSVNPRFKRERWLGYIAGENGPNGGAL
jgi:hypothetical protein